MAMRRRGTTKHSPTVLFDRVSLIFVVFSLLSALGLGGLLIRRALSGSALAWVCLAALPPLGWRWVREYRSRPRPSPADLLEGATLAATAVAIGSPADILLLLYARLSLRSMVGTPRQVWWITSVYGATFLSAIALTHRHTLPVTELVLLASGFPMAAPVMHFLGLTLAQLQRSVRTERALARANAALAVAAERSDVCLAARDAAADLMGGPGTARVIVALGAAGPMVVMADSETPPVRHVTPSQEVMDALRQGDVGWFESLDELGVVPVGPQADPPDPSVARGVAVPLMVRGQLEGIVVVASSVTSDAVQGLVALAANVAMALGRAAMTEELHRQHHERNFQILARHMSDIITIVEADGSVRYSSPATAVLGEHPQSLPAGIDALGFIHPEDQASTRRAFAKAMRTPGTSAPIRFRTVHADGTWHHAEATANNLLDSPDINGVVVTTRDVTRAVEAEAALRASEARFRMLFDQNPQPMWVYDLETQRFLEVNAAAVDHYGFSREQFLAMTIADIRPQAERLRLHESLTAAGRASHTEGSWYHQTSDGRIIDVELASNELAFGDRPARLVAVTDVTQRNALERELRHRALHDGLTGLPNRALLLDRIGHTLERQGREGATNLAVLFIDIDHFKVINDSLGHTVGDCVLVETASRLRRATSAGDTAARFGGDEFVVSCEEIVTVEEALALAREIQTALSRPITLGSEGIYPAVSIGIALSSARTSSAESLLRDADTALSRAKAGGRGRIEMFDPSMHSVAKARMEIDAALRAGLEAGQFRLDYQPLISLTDGTTVGAEALLRWDHPLRGEIGPADFIPLAEETGLIIPLGEWVFEQACLQAARWQRQAPQTPFTVAVNLSVKQLGSAGLAEAFQRSLALSGVDPARIVIEITESVFLEESRVVADQLLAVEALGVALSLDDFGTRYSSLAYLRRFPFDTVKVDRSFVTGVDADAKDAAIVAGIVSLAQSLGLTVVAEGVEFETQLNVLRRLRVDMAQGYYLGRPGPAAALETLFASGSAGPGDGKPAHPVLRGRARPKRGMGGDPDVAPEVVRAEFPGAVPTAVPAPAPAATPGTEPPGRAASAERRGRDLNPRTRFPESTH